MRCVAFRLRKEKATLQVMLMVVLDEEFRVLVALLKILPDYTLNRGAARV
jgi:hypothetical protein